MTSQFPETSYHHINVDQMLQKKKEKTELAF